MLAAFLGAGENVPRGTSEPKAQGFDALIMAIGGPNPKFPRQESLPPKVRRSIEEMQKTPAYQRYREKLAKRNGVS